MENSVTLKEHDGTKHIILFSKDKSYLISALKEELKVRLGREDEYKIIFLGVVLADDVDVNTEKYVNKSLVLIKVKGQSVCQYTPDSIAKLILQISYGDATKKYKGVRQILMRNAKFKKYYDDNKEIIDELMTKRMKEIFIKLEEYTGENDEITEIVQEQREGVREQGEEMREQINAEQLQNIQPILNNMMNSIFNFNVNNIPAPKEIYLTEEQEQQVDQLCAIYPAFDREEIIQMYEYSGMDIDLTLSLLQK